MPTLAREVPWESLDSDLKEKYRTAGTRGERRTDVEARRVRATVCKTGVCELGQNDERKAIRDKDWSHKVPHKVGGGNNAGNGVFESASKNRSRGARMMTRAEVKAAERELRKRATRHRLLRLAKGAGWSGFGGALVGAAIAIYKNQHLVSLGCLSDAEASTRTVEDLQALLAVGAITGAAIGVVVAVIAMLSARAAVVTAAFLSAAALLLTAAGAYEDIKAPFMQTSSPTFTADDLAAYGELAGYAAQLATACAVGEITIAEENDNNPAHWIWAHDALGQPYTLHRDVFRLGAEIGIGPHRVMPGWIAPPRLP